MRLNSGMQKSNLDQCNADRKYCHKEENKIGGPGSSRPFCSIAVDGF